MSFHHTFNRCRDVQPRCKLQAFMVSIVSITSSFLFIFIYGSPLEKSNSKWNYPRWESLHRVCCSKLNANNMTLLSVECVHGPPSVYTLHTPNAISGEHRTDICNGCRRPIKCHTTCLDSSAATIFVFYLFLREYPYWTYTHIGGTDCNQFFFCHRL